MERGILADAFIGEGTKLGNLTPAAHNVQTGRHCIIVAEVFIGGSRTIGGFTWIAPQACIRDQIRPGRNVLVGMGALVTNDVPDNATVLGLPAREARGNPPIAGEAARTTENLWQDMAREVVQELVVNAVTIPSQPKQ